MPLPSSGAAAEAPATGDSSSSSSSSAAVASPQMPPSDPSPSAAPAAEEKTASDGSERLSSSDDADDASIDAFSLETVLTDARRDVTAVTGWGPDAVLVALDGGCLLVLRRDRKLAGGKGKATSPLAPSSMISAARRSVPTTTAAGSASTSSASALADAAAPWRLAAAHSHLASRRIAQLEVVSSGSGKEGEKKKNGGELLLALTEEGVTAFRLPGFTMTAQADRTAGSSRFAWQPGPRLLAVVVGGGAGAGSNKKKVSVFRHDGKEFVPLRELFAPEQPLAVAWAGPCVLVSGSSGSWWALRLSTSEASSSSSSPSSSALPASEEIFPSCASSSSKDSSCPFLPLACPFSSSSSPSRTSSAAAAAAVSLGRRGAALVASDGRPARGGRAPSLWRGAGAPAALAASPPWLCAALPGGVEVRPLDPSLSPDLLCQTLPLACMAVAGFSSSSSSSSGGSSPSGSSGNGDVFFAGGGRVARLRPRALVAVAAAACAAGRHADAAALAALAPEADPRRGRALDSARRALAGSVFAAGDFEGALALLGMLGRSESGASSAAANANANANANAAAVSTSAAASPSVAAPRPPSPPSPTAFGPLDAAAPLALLRLFPSLAPADLLEVAEASCCCDCEEEGGGGGEDGEDEEEEEEEEEEDERGEKGQEDGIRRRKPTSSSSWPAPKLPAEPTGDAYEKAVAALLPYLLSFRGRLMAAVGGGKSDEEKEGETTAATTTSSFLSSPSTLSPAALDSLASLVDTAVLLAMLAAPDDSGAALRFVSSSSSTATPSRCRLSDVAPRLSAKGRYAELVALLRGAGRHEAALDLLRKLSTDPGSLEGAKPTGAAADLAGAVTGAWAAARYLLRPAPASSSLSLGGTRPDLVHEHGRWIVSADADAGLDLLLGLEPPPPPEAALAVLRSSRNQVTVSSSPEGAEAAAASLSSSSFPPSPGLAAAYLTAAVERGIAPAARWEGELAGLCLRAALCCDEKEKEEEEEEQEKEKRGGGPASLLPPPPVGPARGAELPYARLLSLVDSSQNIDPSRLLALLPAGALLAARARLLSRLGRVREALQCAAVELGDDGLAEEIAARACAERQQRQQRGGAGGAAAAAPSGGRGESSSSGNSTGVASASASSSSDPASAPVDPYLELIRLFLQRDENDEEGEHEKAGSGRKGWAAAARLLATAAPPSSSSSSAALDAPSSSSSFSLSSPPSRRPVLDPSAAIDLLPEDAPLIRARPLVAAALSGAREARARASVGKGLSRADALGARAAAAAARRRGVRLSSERGCAACGKGFAAGTAFALLPRGGGVMHYGCFRARERAAGRRVGATTEGAE